MPRPSTLDDYTGRIARVTSHIQANLDEECSLDALASLAAFSPCHFHRVFRAITGEGVAAHVRRLRLERAARQLKLSDRPVVDIALAAGYETHESFTRAFQSAFNLAPSAWRSGLKIPELPAVDFELKQIGPLAIAKLRHVGPYPEVGRTFARLSSWIGSRSLFGPWTRAIGICHDDPEVTEPARLRYDAAFLVPHSLVGSDGVEFAELPRAAYVTTTHRGPYEGLSITYAALIRAALSGSSHRALADRGSLEFYLNTPENSLPGELLTEICLPFD